MNSSGDSGVPATLNEVLAKEVPQSARRLIDEPWVTFLAVISTLPFAAVLFRQINCLGESPWSAICPASEESKEALADAAQTNILSGFSNAAAGSLVALCAIGITVVVMAMPLLLSTRFALIDADPAAAKKRLRGVVAVYWINIKSMMLNGGAAAAFAMLGNINFQWGWMDEAFSAIVPFFVVQGFGRCWILVREAMEVVIAAVNSIPTDRAEGAANSLEQSSLPQKSRVEEPPRRA